MFFLPCLVKRHSPRGGPSTENMFFKVSVSDAETSVARTILRNITFNLHSSLRITEGLKVGVREAGVYNNKTGDPL